CAAKTTSIAAMTLAAARTNRRHACRPPRPTSSERARALDEGSSIGMINSQVIGATLARATSDARDEPRDHFKELSPRRMGRSARFPGMRKDDIGGRFPGSRLERFRVPSQSVLQWPRYAKPRRSQLRGQPQIRTAFPFDSGRAPPSGTIGVTVSICKTMRECRDLPRSFARRLKLVCYTVRLLDPSRHLVELELLLENP